MNPAPVIVVTSAYGADFVRLRGQDFFIPLVAGAGADGIEIRRELRSPAEPNLAALGAMVTAHGLFAVYSAPLDLWSADGAFAGAELAAVLAEAEALGAHWLKLTLGHYSAACDLAPLARLLAGRDGPRLMIENDQTEHGGTIAQLAPFLDACRHAGVPVGMVFDTGNWRWTATEPADAARALGKFVDYVHCKGIAGSAGRLRAVPLNDEAGDWPGVFRAFRPGVPRAVEFPLAGPDLAALTRSHVDGLRAL